MKYLKLLITCMLIWTGSFAQVITIDAFENTKRDKFDDKKVITPEALSGTFKIVILDVSGITKIQQPNAAKNYNDVPVSEEKVTGGKMYVIEGVKPENGIVQIKLFKVGEEKTLTLGKEIEKKTAATDCNSDKNYNNNFGEEAMYYDKDKIVYVYDFNKDPSKREFYKITLNDKEGLDRHVVNFNKETLTPGKNVKFKIYNINKFMFNVSIADSVIHFDSEPPELFRRLFLGDTSLMGNLLGKFTKEVVSQSFADSKDAKTLMDSISSFMEKYNELKERELNVLNPCAEFECCNKIDYAGLLNDITAIKAQEENVKRKLQKEKDKIVACGKSIKQKVYAETKVKNHKYELAKFSRRFDELSAKNAVLTDNKTKIEKEIKQIESRIYFTNGPDSLTKKAQLVRLVNELTAITAELTSSQTNLGKARTSRDSVDLLLDKSINALDSLEMAINESCNKEVQEMLDALEISSYLIKNLPHDTDLKKLVVFINNITVFNNAHTSDYISLDGNMLDLTINISSKDSIFKYFAIPLYKINPIRIQIPILWKPFASFSSGSFIALGKYLQNKTYSAQEIIGTNNTLSGTDYTIVESGYTNPPMGFCAFGNIEWKFRRSMGFGASAGAGLTIEKTPRMAYMAGASLFLGDARQFALTGGFIGMQVDKLNFNFETNADKQVVYTSKPTMEYYKEFKVGGFISLTYTPFKIYKTKTIKSTEK